MTPREPDRYELAPDALERIARAFEANPTAQHSGAAVASVLRYLARGSPAAAPAADMPFPVTGADGQCLGYSPAPASAPAAPAPDLVTQRSRFEKCAQLFAEIRGDWTDPRDACREGRKLCMEALADIDAALAASAATPAKGEGK